MSDELYSQQKEISNFKKKINEFDNGIETNVSKEDKKPPHY